MGLKIHPGKTKILSNQSLNIRKEIEIDDIKVEILTREESTKYLGQMITFQQQETSEIRNRIRAAWATFHKYRQELTSRTFGTWTLTKEHENEDGHSSNTHNDQDSDISFENDTDDEIDTTEKKHRRSH